MKQSKQYWKLSSTANCHKHIRMRIDYEQSLFFLSPSSENARDENGHRRDCCVVCRTKGETARILHVYGNSASLRLFFFFFH